MQWLKTWVLRANRPGFKFQPGHQPAAGLYLGKFLCCICWVTSSSRFTLDFPRTGNPLSQPGHTQERIKMVLSFWGVKPNCIRLLWCLGSFFRFVFIYFLTEGKVFYNVVMFSALQQHKSAIIIHISPLSWASLHPPIPSHPSRSSPGWAPCVIQKLLTSYLVYTQ